MTGPTVRLATTDADVREIHRAVLEAAGYGVVTDDRTTGSETIDVEVVWLSVDEAAAGPEVGPDGPPLVLVVPSALGAADPSVTPGDRPVHHLAAPVGPSTLERVVADVLDARS